MPRKQHPPDKPSLIAPGLTWNPNGTYQARVEMSATWTWVETFGPDQKQTALDEIAKKKLERSAGRRQAPATDSVAGLLAAWLAWKKGELADSSVDRYRTSVDQLSASRLGAIAVVKLGVGDVEEWIAASTAAPSTTRDVIGVLSQAYDMALRRSMPGVLMNPVRVARKPKVRRQPKMAARLVTVQTIIDALPAERRIAGYIAYEAGLRRGEIGGLTIGDIDYDAKEITVWRQWRKRPGRGQGYEELKNHERRVVPVGNSQLLRRIREHLIAQGGPGEYGAILRGVDGRPISTAALTRTWQAARAASGVELDGWHALRHAFGSYHLANGEDAANIAAWMGHTYETFIRHYGRRTPDAVPRTDLGALAEQARDAAGTSPRETRVTEEPEHLADVVEMGKRRRTR